MSEDFVPLALLDHFFQIVEAFADAVIGQAVLGKVISSDLVCPLAATHIFDKRINQTFTFFILQLIQFGGQKLRSYLSIGLLVAFPAGRNHDTGRLMGKSDRS